ncbi:hypothetical protein TL16_g13237 [Triparma laevis f. inornata]|uniref:Uncharacterized protein n=2 Tax=Triparma laevis TaxID=1534972 RepID=A0A9W7EC25_9STRA|nr:hypothetical protein TrLO_g13729 [Triparma laevis f. longispina]GMH95806.1 hypothetical protein TL16_g13237 [Triparma laevis f. inornata]
MSTGAIFGSSNVVVYAGIAGVISVWLDRFRRCPAQASTILPRAAILTLQIPQIPNSRLSTFPSHSMSKKTAEPPKTEEPASDMSPDSFRKFMRYGTYPTPTSFPTLPNYVFNLRLILSTIFGIYLGYLGVTGSKVRRHEEQSDELGMGRLRE